jgi:predicted transposase/invertase (TIGR01784 family)
LIPDILKEQVFLKGFEIARIANFNEKELAEYEDSLKIYRDLKGVIDTSFEEGEKVGFEKGYDKGKDENAREMAKAMKIKGYPIEDISEITKIPKEEIKKI